MLLFFTSRSVSCPVVQFGQLTQCFCVLPVLAGWFFAVREGFQKLFGCRWKVDVFFTFLLQKSFTSAIIIDRNRDCALGCAASVLWWNRSSVLLWSVCWRPIFYATKDKSTVVGWFIVCSAVLDYRRLVYSCQLPNLYNLHQIFLIFTHSNVNLRYLIALP